MGWGRVVIRDLTTQTTTLASVGEEFHADLATFSPDGAWLAYTSGVVGIERVGGALQVTAHPEPGGMESPAFSPDSEKVLFRTWEPLDPRDQNIVADVYLVDLDTGEVELVSANDAQSGSGNHISGAYVDRSVFSPDGSRIASRAQRRPHPRQTCRSLGNRRLRRALRRRFADRPCHR